MTDQNDGPKSTLLFRQRHFAERHAETSNGAKVAVEAGFSRDAMSAQHLAGLTAREVIFVHEYLIDLDPERAALAAGYKASVARTKAYGWVSNSQQKPRIYGAVKAAIAARAQRLSIKADEVLHRLSQLATSDPRELVEFRRGACRHCYGAGHGFQWTTPREFHDASMSAAAQKLPPPAEEGGFGFNGRRAPNPTCPECFGDGVGQVFIHDMRGLSPGAALLFNGIRQSQGAIQVLLESRLRALSLLARHLGLLDGTAPPKSLREDPLSLLLHEVQAATHPSRSSRAQ